MLGRIKELFMAQSQSQPRPEATEEDTEERVRLATCVLLVEMATADDEYAPEERAHIMDTLCTKFALSSEDAEELLAAAQERREASFDLWKFTNQINQACSHPEKIAIIKEIWRVVYADGTLDGHEDYLIHKMAKLLNLTHPQLIQAKMTVLEENR